MRDFSEAPFLVIWETTQACDLLCKHCRASARPDRDPGELSTGEAKELLQQVKRLGDPLMVFTGGDPLKRDDLFELLEYSVSLGLRTTVTPSATPLLTRAAVKRFKKSGVSRMAISIDGANSFEHDEVRQVDGSFRTSIGALQNARDFGLETQVNTTVTRTNMSSLGDIAKLVAETGAKLWSVFFLIVTGRAQLEDDLTSDQYEQVFELLYETSLTAPFDIKTTEAQHYRRYVAQRRKRDGLTSLSRPGVPPDTIARQAGINDGKGFVFVSHTGQIYPSGFLAITTGNVRDAELGDVYRNAPLFQSLRDSSQLDGKCGDCEYNELCGGSRSRAYSLTGDYLGSDPRCAHIPVQSLTGARVILSEKAS
jgi:radical SAM protein